MPMSQMTRLTLWVVSSGLPLSRTDAPCLSHTHGYAWGWPGASISHLHSGCTTHTHTHPLPPLQGCPGLSRAKGGSREQSMVFPAAGLLLPESEGGRNGRGVGWGWTGEVGVGGTGCLFYGRISFSLETLHGGLPSTPLLFLE